MCTLKGGSPQDIHRSSSTNSSSSTSQTTWRLGPSMFQLCHVAMWTSVSAGPSSLMHMVLLRPHDSLKHGSPQTRPASQDLPASHQKHLVNLPDKSKSACHPTILTGQVGCCLGLDTLKRSWSLEPVFVVFHRFDTPHPSPLGGPSPTLLPC